MNEELQRLISTVALRTGLDPALLRAFVQIESSGRPDARAGSHKGLLQLSDAEFAKWGGSGDIYDPEANLMAGAKKLKAAADQFASQYGRAPQPVDLYLEHQQGPSGYRAHMTNPDGLAWENVSPYYTAAGALKRGYPSAEAYAKAAIWGNVPADVKKQFPGGVDTMTSADFMRIWGDRVSARMGGAGGGNSVQTAAAGGDAPQSAPAPVRRSGMAMAASAPPSAPLPSRRPDPRSSFGLPAEAVAQIAKAGAAQPRPTPGLAEYLSAALGRGETQTAAAPAAADDGVQLAMAAAANAAAAPGMAAPAMQPFALGGGRPAPQTDPMQAAAAIRSQLGAGGGLGSFAPRRVDPRWTRRA